MQAGQGTGFASQAGAQFPQGGFARGGVAGKVASIEGYTITLTTPEGPVRVLITDRMVLRRVTALTLDELQPGSRRWWSATGTLRGNPVARSVQVGVTFRPGP